ncbi:MAG: spermidine/putrescine ABC transporter substrate-binding protein [Clostridia bacterium]
MKKLLSILLSTMLILSCFSACSQEEEEAGELNLYTWEGMFPQSVLDAFTEETGIVVNYNNFDTDETMLSKLQAADGGDYDLVIADDYIIETAIAEGLVQKLDTSKLSNISSVNPAYQGQFYDPNDEYTVPYGAGVMAMVYNPENVDIEITSYEDLWDASLEDSIGVIGNSRVVTGITLMSMGESMNTEDVATIEAAGEKLLELAPNIRLIKDANIQDDLLSGEIDVALMYSSQTTMAMLTNPELEVVFPEEGVGFGVMAEFIPANAPNAESAYKFIDFILQADTAAECYEYLGYYSANTDADPLIAEEYQSFLTLPDDIDTSKMEMIQNISNEALEAHTLVWTAFKSATE